MRRCIYCSRSQVHFPRAPHDWTCSDCRPFVRPKNGLSRDLAETIVRRMIAASYFPAQTIWEVLGIDEYTFTIAWENEHGTAPNASPTIDWLREAAVRFTGARPRTNEAAVTALTMLVFGHSDAELPDDHVRAVLAVLTRVDDERPELRSTFVDAAIRRLRNRLRSQILGV